MRVPGAAVGVGFGVIAIGLGAGVCGWVGRAWAGAETRPSRVAIELGSRLFQRKWIPNDLRCHGGDGLGPVYNESSCVACHNLGGTGGAGSNARNVEIITPVAVRGFDNDASGIAAARALSERIKRATGLPVAGSVVLHRSGSRREYDSWRRWLLANPFGDFTLQSSPRNTPALFGVGLIDALPDSVLEKAARKTYARFPEVHGRVCRLKDGRIGRFGWKAQLPSLDEFVLTACSVELGLEVPGHHQSTDPSFNLEATVEEKGAAELDLSAVECFALTSYIRSLPAPVEVEPTNPEMNERRLAGGAVFKTIGCAACHSPTLGDIDGIYSDLLLHDLGPENSDSGAYYSDPSESVEDVANRAVAAAGNSPGPQAAQGKQPAPEKEKRDLLGATRQEWRTTPLWGLRDSFPYMHNGSAWTFERAIARHGGEGKPAAERYAALKGAEKTSLRAFLMSLAAPKAAAKRPAATPRGGLASQGP